jgi:hypothetical protein
MELGSADSVTSGFGGGSGFTGAGGGGGGGGGGFLHPAANAIRKILSKTSAMLLFVDMVLLRLLKVLFHWNDRLLEPPAHRFVRTSDHNGSWCDGLYLTPQKGCWFFPCVVSLRSCLPSARMVQICVPPERFEAKVMWVPLGDQVGCSFLPAP